MNGGNNPGVYVTKTVAIDATPGHALPKSALPPLPKALSRLANWLNETAADVQRAIEEPREGLKGAAKGTANIPSYLAELLLKGQAGQQALEISEAGAIQKLIGNEVLAKRMADFSDITKQSAATAELPKFNMTNAAQRGGDTISTIVQMAYGGVGLAKGTVRSLAPAFSLTRGSALKEAERSATAHANHVGPRTPAPLSINAPTGGGIKIIPTAAGSTSKSSYQKIVGQIPGKVLNEADALNPGALGDELKGIAETFSGGRYATIKLDRPLTVYRAWAPGQSNEFGAFWALEKPRGSLQSRIDSALLPEWGKIRGTTFNAQATHYSIIEIPAGTTIHVGEVGSQGGMWVGGKSQLLIDGGTKPAWKTGGGTLQ
jgi:hypothetical protein